MNLSLIQRKTENTREQIRSQKTQDNETSLEDGLYYEGFAGYLIFILIALLVLVYAFYEP